jgi:hypothetical protein
LLLSEGASPGTKSYKAWFTFPKGTTPEDLLNSSIKF